MASVNKVLLLGNLTRDPELRYTSGGSSVCNFSMAMNSKFKGKDGDMKEETLFMRITVWGKQGESCAQYLTKGRAVFVEGRLQTREWEAEDGTKRKSTNVIATNVQFLSDGKKIDRPAADNDDIPF